MGLDADGAIALRKTLDNPPKLPAPAKLEALRQAVRANGGTLHWKKILGPVFGPGKLTIDEALYFGVYRDEVTDADARRFVGKSRQNKFHFQCNDLNWFAAAHDKALFYTAMKGAGLRVPHTRAVSGEKHRAGYPKALRSKDEVAAFLEENRDWPLFLKPIDGMYSVGAMKAVGAADGQVALFGGERFPAAAVAEYMAALSKVGYLFQDCLA
ncbi:MAG: hypothetical protein ACREFQ_06125, partial [Stellaceae bacterium]